MYPDYLKAALLYVLVAFCVYALDHRYGTVRRFLSEQRAPVNLAFARVVIFSLLLIEYPLHTLLNYSGLSQALLLGPDGWGHLVRLIPRSALCVEVVYAVFFATTLCAVAGAFFRWTSGISTATAFYLFTIPQLWGKVNHDHHLILFALILTLSPSADALSVDAWRRRDPVDPLAPTLRHGFPVTAMMLVMALAYLGPGIWKIARAGSGWFSGENMRLLILYKLQETPITHLQAWAASQPKVLFMGALYGVLFEIGFTFLILSKRTRLIAFAAGIAFHCGTFALMAISFFTLQACYVVLIDWAALLRRRETAPSHDAPPRYLRPVTAVVIVGMVLAGLTHTVDAWPIACYPTFDWKPSSEYHSLRLQAVDVSGRAYSDDLTFDPRLNALFSAERWRVITLADTAPGVSYPRARAEAIVDFWKDHNGDPHLRTASLFLDTHSFERPGTLSSRTLSEGSQGNW